MVFSITVDQARLREALATVAEGGVVCMLTPHVVFEHERRWVAEVCEGQVEYRTFHDLLGQVEAELCDTEADRLVVEKNPQRSGRVGEYYRTIKYLKNKAAAGKLSEEFVWNGGAVFCDDLGICADVWRAEKLKDCVPRTVVRRVSMVERLKRWCARSVRCQYLSHRGQCWLLVGRPERLGQYLEREGVALRSPSRAGALWLGLQLIMFAGPGGQRRVVRWLWWAVNSAWRQANGRVTWLVAAVHEDSGALECLAEALGMKYGNLQDSFLPSYYPSRYLLYRPAVERFYVWDDFSHGIFKRHGLVSERWSGYRSWRLPQVRDAKAVRCIVYLSSGAGDWSALKNRSDEDLALELLVRVARARPDIKILYRPHPLWLHPEHQGVDSINRVVRYLEMLELPNIRVSQGAQMDGRGFLASANLSVVSSTVEEDMQSADLVLGEHSQTMLVAAQSGKVIAGVNVAKHTPYFADYVHVGFPLIESTKDLLGLVERMENPKERDEFLMSYNAAVERHNRENAVVESEAAGRVYERKGEL